MRFLKSVLWVYLVSQNVPANCDARRRAEHLTSYQCECVQYANKQWWGRPHKLNCTQQATDFVAPTFFDTCSKKTLPLVEITVSAGPRARCEASWPTTHHSHVQHARLTRWRCGVIRCNEDR